MKANKQKNGMDFLFLDNIYAKLFSLRQTLKSYARNTNTNRTQFFTQKSLTFYKV